jgi:2-phospho-L-lactate guanylyltransferase
VNDGIPAGGPDQRGWTIVLPVKHAEQAKRRLQTPPGVDRLALVRAIAVDSLRAVRSCPLVARLVVVTSDPVVRAAADDMADVVPDPGAGLLEAIRAGVRPGGPLAVLLPDVPALRPADLSTALTACAPHETAFVPDLEGTGTVLLTARRHTGLRPAFGPGSAAAHEAGGAVRLDLELPSLRRDVDTWAALQQARALGVGSATAAATTAA